MKQQDEKKLYHVVSLTKDQQAALKYCYFNAVSLKVLFQLNQLAANPTMERVAAAGDSILKGFAQYDKITNEWPLLTELSSVPGKTRLCYYEHNDFFYLKASLDKFDFDTAALIVGDFSASKVQSQLQSLKSLFKDSSLYEFTYEEIMKGIVKR